MKILVTGASGYIGQAAVRALIAAGHVVTGLARSNAAADVVRKLGAGVAQADLTDVAAVRALASKHDASLHAAGISGPDRAAQDRAAIFALVDGAKDAGGARAVVYTSGYWILGDTGNAPADESAPTDAPAELSVFRVALEKDVLAAATDDVVTSVVRPGMVYGGAQGVVAWFDDWVAVPADKKGHLVMVGEGQNRWSVVHDDDVADLYRAVLEQRASGIFHAVEADAPRVADIGRALARVSGLPGPVAWPLAEAKKKLGPLADALVLDDVASAPRSFEVLGWRPKRGPLMAVIEGTWHEYANKNA